MRLSIESTNPFYDHPRFAFGFEHIKHFADGTKLLDYGCNDGSFGRQLRQWKDIDYFGVDKNADVKPESEAGFVVHIITDELPFPDEFFDAATIFEVLEHVQDQDGLLSEIRRVLKPGGTLIASTPRKHIFSVLDFGNLKFVFPRLHRAVYTMQHSREAYEYRYVNNPYGLVGDVESEKAWHQHFRDEEMRDLMTRNGFAVEEIDAAGLFSTVFDVISALTPFGRLFTQKLRNWDSYTFAGRMLFCRATKPEA